MNRGGSRPKSAGWRRRGGRVSDPLAADRLIPERRTLHPLAAAITFLRAPAEARCRPSMSGALNGFIWTELLAFVQARTCADNAECLRQILAACRTGVQRTERRNAPLHGLIRGPTGRTGSRA